MLNGILTKLGFIKTEKQLSLGEASRVKKAYELAPKNTDKLVRSPKKDTFTSSNSVIEQVVTEQE